MGTYCFSLGIIGFLVCAAQVYGSKPLRRGVVHSWISSRIRHPQYLCLAMAGIGMLTTWPRIIILVLYAGMVLIYYFLAGFEEKQMEVTYTDYAAYHRRTAMFIPRNPGGKLFQCCFGWIPNRSLALAASSAVVVVLMIISGLFLRHYTIDHAATELLPAAQTLAIAIWPESDDRIGQVVSVALRDDKVRSALEKDAGAVFTAHVLPADYSMVDMFADVGTDHHMFGELSPYRFRYLLGLVFPFLRHDHWNRVMGAPRENYKVIFSLMDGPKRDPVPLSSVTGLEAKMTPVVIANISGEHPALQDVIVPPRRSLWGDITMPMF